jgi:ATP-dependent helicase/nuclease subunit A
MTAPAANPAAGLTARTLAGAAQNRASDPLASVWVAANAGAGKTRVLIDRVTRLLIRGAPPGRILCLTYTRAAAAEMQNRLFARLGRWAMLPDATLRDELAALDEAGADLAPARRLFAQALEVPDGLKIQTIHAFCASVLRRFPLEAGIAPGFRELDERAAAQLRAEAVDSLALDAADLCDALFAADPRGDVDALAGEILRHRAAFAGAPDRGAIWRRFGLSPDDTPERLWADTFGPADDALLARLVARLRHGKPTDKRAADRLARAGLGVGAGAIAEDGEVETRLAALEAVCLYGESAAKAGPFTAKIGAFPTRDTRAALGADLAPLEALMRRVEAARPRRLGLAAAQAGLALDRFARGFLDAYDARKVARGALDFDDLIDGVGRLLSDSTQAQWVLWKLDGGLDHILIDEAQDTSPAQWAVIRKLAEEFMAGSGAERPSARTLFVVGDEKQSIYSFQGADPAGFATTRAHFDARLAGTDSGLVPGQLVFSFRSAPAILQAVDAVFAAGRPGIPATGRHQAFYNARPGRVDVWPAIPAAPAEEPPDWSVPAALRPAEATPSVLARHLAATVAGWLADGTRIDTGRPGDPRPIAPGDILFLVQRRGAVFHALLAALKAAGLPVAGADRLRLLEELGVRDLVALLSFLATPDDDLSLAACLRGPLFGLGEDALFRLAHGRSGTLWQALRAAPEHRQAVDMLRDLRAQAGFLRPFELLDRVLTRHGGRARLLARLGVEARDGLDALLARALEWERGGLGELTGFLGWLTAEDSEIKREMEAASGRIRVMTTHGAKGLQAPVVILPDTVRAPPAPRDRVLPLVGDGVGFRVPMTAGAGPLVQSAAERRDRDAEERNRLLYVAMTRAEAWLIVAGAGDAKAEDWHGAVTAGLTDLDDVRPLDTPAGPGLRLSGGVWPDPARAKAPENPAAGLPDLPDWARAPAPPAPRPAAPIRPSDLGPATDAPADAAPLPGTDAASPTPEAARARGAALHRLLEHLPAMPGDPVAASLRLLPDWPAPERAALLAEARAVLADPALEFLFGPGTLAETGIALPGDPPLLGRIDRLAIGAGRVLAVDFKSGVAVPARPAETPVAILRQMAAYAHALRRVWPDRRIETAILWTRAPCLMALPDGLVERAAAGLALPP